MLELQGVYFQQLFDNSPYGIVILDKNDRIIDVNKAFEKIFQYSIEEVKGRNLDELVAPEYLLEEAHHLSVAVKGKELIQKETVRKRKDGSLVYVLLTGYPIYYKDELIGGYAIYRDITKRKKMEDALDFERKQLLSILDSVEEAIYITDPKTYEILYANPFLKKLFGRELTGEICYEAFQNRDFPCEFCTNEIILKNKGKPYKWEFHNPVVDRDFFLIDQIIRWPDGRDVRLEFAVDITDLKKAEEEKRSLQEQLFLAQKMESIGRLAGGIAHDFNNILTGIMGYAELLKMKFPDTNTMEGKAAEVIFRGTGRAADLTKQLLGFARGGKYNPVPLNINDVIREVVEISEKIFEKKIEVKYEFEENVGIIEADQSQIEQVLMNLIINARDAMPLGGKITFKTENTYIDKKYSSRFPEFKAGNYVKISIIDTGTGIPREVKEHIFEPFFTTKGVGKGTGLGLATVYGIIKNHDGHINVYSEPGKGTVFNIYLPVSEVKVIEKEEENLIKGSGTILLIDDEEVVRNVSANQLESLGYNVLTAADGTEAIDIYRSEAGSINLVLLDMIMPGMSGTDIYLALKEINPDVKILLISGFSQNGRATDLMEKGALGFIQKPFKMYELSKAIFEAMKK